MSVDQKSLKHIAQLSNLKLTEEEIDLYGEQIKKIVSYFDDLRSVDDHLSSDWRGDILGSSTPERVDQVESSLPIIDVLNNTEVKTTYAFQVPRIIE